MRIVLVNPAYDDGLDADELLGRYDTLTGWGEALLRAGADRVTTVQRFSRDLDLERSGVSYLFRTDGAGSRPRPVTRSRAVLGAVSGARADLVHANGLLFPEFLGRLRKALAASTPLVVQHHAGWPTPRGRLSGALRRLRWTRGLRGVDGFLFTSVEQAQPWQAAGLIAPSQAIYAVPESGRSMRCVPREEARRRSGLRGRPQVLSVGHLVAQKDPMTAIEGFRRALDSLPEAELALAYRRSDLLAALRERLAGDERLGSRVRFLGTLAGDALADAYCAADVFVSASRDEGSGYALIEAMSCGVVPVVTDIPSFRALTGGGMVGRLWATGAADSLASALVAVGRQPLGPQREAVARHFEAVLSWPAVGRRAMEIYRRAMAARVP